MKPTKSLWVLGHKVTPLESTGDFDIVLGETPPNVPGPPPHFHSTYAELFFVTEGEMTFSINGEIRILKAGESIDIPPKAVHTFLPSDRGSKWINIHSPKGFLSFFLDQGVDVDSTDAMIASVHESRIQKVMQTAQNYDMNIEL